MRSLSTIVALNNTIPIIISCGDEGNSQISQLARGRRTNIPAPPLQRLVDEGPAQPVPLDRLEVRRRRRREQPAQVPARAKKIENDRVLPYHALSMAYMGEDNRDNIKIRAPEID